MGVNFDIRLGGNAESAFDKLIAAINKTVGSFSKVTTSADSFAKNTESKMKSASKDTKSLSNNVDELKTKLEKVNNVRVGARLKSDFKEAGREARKLQSEIQKLESKGSAGGGRSGGGWGMGMLGRWIAPVAIAGGLMAGGMASSKASIGFEQTNKSFEVLTGSQTLGQGLANNLNSLQQNTILGPEVFKNAQTMLGFGITVDKILPSMRMLGDVSMGNADKMERLTLAFSQVQAAGKLMGQDLLQFINAGFNPLQQISKNTGKSMAVLKKEMEDGKISAKMVEDAFASATSKGGLFNGMLDKMAETTGGKIAQLQGGFESLKIAAGDRLKPTIDVLTDSVSKLVSNIRGWLAIPMSEKLRTEQSEVNTLVGAITSLNEGNDIRKGLLDELARKYPELLGNIDKEKVTNSELLKILTDVNSAYERRIGMALTNEELEDAKSNTKGAFDSATLAKKAEQEFLKGNTTKGNLLLRQAQGEPAISGLQGWLIPNKYNVDDARSMYNQFETGLKNNVGIERRIEGRKTLEGNLDKIAELSKKMEGGDKTIPANVAAMVTAAMPSIEKYWNSKGADGEATINDFIGADFSWLNFDQKLKKAAGGNGTDTGTTKSKSGDIISGGSKPTTINLTIHKLQEQVVVHTTNLQMGAKQAADQIVEEILQALNSVSNKMAEN